MMITVRKIAIHLTTLELPILALLTIGALGVERLLPVALLGAAFFWPVRWLAHGRLTVRTPGDWPVGLLVMMVPVTLWATALPEVTRSASAWAAPWDRALLCCGELG